MGLFSSKTKTQVGTQVQRVIEDGALPNAILNGVSKSLFGVESNGEQMIEYIFDEVTNSIALRAKSMYKYGRDGYVYGLPKSTIKSSQAGKVASKAAIEAELNQTVQINYYHFGPLNNLHLAWQKLVSVHGYDSNTNKLEVLSVQKGKDVFLYDMQVVVTHASLEEMENGSLDQWGTPPSAGTSPKKKYQIIQSGSLGKPTTFAVDPNATGDYVRVDYCWEEDVPAIVDGITIQRKTIKEDSFTIPMTGFDMLADYHQVKYVLSNGKAGYWIYRTGDGTHAAVDNVFHTEYEDSGSFFPITYLRYNKAQLTEDNNPVEYKSSEKLLNYINMDYTSLVDGVNANPDIADVEQALIMMAVPAVTENSLEQRYLFDFFSNIQNQTINENNNFNLPQIAGIKLNLGHVQTDTSIVIQDKRFKMALSYREIVKQKVSGNFGEIGAYASGYSSTQEDMNIPVLGGIDIVWPKESEYHYYRHQVTNEIYEEIRITNLKMTYWIFEQYTTTGDGTDKILMIPLDIGITENYSIPDRETLYSRGLHYVFNSRVVTKLKWYQTGIFKALLIIAAIVITILSHGTTIESIGAAIAAGTFTLAQFGLLVLSGLLEYLVVTMAVKIFVKLVGIKFAFIAAIVAALAGVTIAINTGSLAGAPWAKDLLMLSTNMTKGIGRELSGDFEDLLAEKTDFEKYMEDQTKLLDKTKDLLNGNNYLSPLLIMGESPNELYQRTVHSGNIGVLSIDAVTSYVDIALQLPQLSDTIGETKYG